MLRESSSLPRGKRLPVVDELPRWERLDVDAGLVRELVRERRLIDTIFEDWRQFGANAKGTHPER